MKNSEILTIEKILKYFLRNNLKKLKQIKIKTKTKIIKIT